MNLDLENPLAHRLQRHTRLATLFPGTSPDEAPGQSAAASPSTGQTPGGIVQARLLERPSAGLLYGQVIGYTLLPGVTGEPSHPAAPNEELPSLDLQMPEQANGTSGAPAPAVKPPRPTAEAAMVAPQAQAEAVAQAIARAEGKAPEAPPSRGKTTETALQRSPTEEPGKELDERDWARLQTISRRHAEKEAAETGIEYRGSLASGAEPPAAETSRLQRTPAGQPVSPGPGNADSKSLSPSGGSVGARPTAEQAADQEAGLTGGPAEGNTERQIETPPPAGSTGHAENELQVPPVERSSRGAEIASPTAPVEATGVVQRGPEVEIQRPFSEMLQHTPPALSGEGAEKLAPNSGGFPGEPNHPQDRPGKNGPIFPAQPESTTQVTGSRPGQAPAEHEGDQGYRAVQADNLPLQAVPLEAAWPVQRRAEAEARPILEGKPAIPAPAPAVQLQPVERTASQLEQALERVTPGQLSASTIEVLPPRFERPIVARPASRQAERWQPEQEESDIPFEPIKQRATAEPRIQSNPSKAEAAETVATEQSLTGPHRASAIETEIGSLPSDLWSLLGEPVPAETGPKPSGPVQRSPAQPGDHQPAETELSPLAGPKDHQAGKPSTGTGFEVVSEHIETVDTEQSLVQRREAQDESPAPGTTDTQQSLDTEQSLPASNAPAAGADLDHLARLVYAEIRQRLSLEWERLRRHG